MTDKKYEAQGFIEALLAVLIAGVAVVALMTLTAHTLGQVARNEIQDQLSQEAVFGANMMDYIIEKYNQDGVFPSQGPPPEGIGNIFLEQRCFTLDGEIGSLRVNEVLSCSYSDANGININNCVRSPWTNPNITPRLSSSSMAVGVEDFRDTMFRLFCVHSDSEFVNPLQEHLLVARIYTGTASCAEITDTGLYIREQLDINDNCIVFEYNAVYRLEN